jgi:hypothetical protein
VHEDKKSTLHLIIGLISEFLMDFLEILEFVLLLEATTSPSIDSRSSRIMKHSILNSFSYRGREGWSTKKSYIAEDVRVMNKHRDKHLGNRIKEKYSDVIYVPPVVQLTESAANFTENLL